MERVILTTWIDPPRRGPGGHFMHYMAYFEGEGGDIEDDKFLRGWGDTALEAKQSLRKAAANK